MTFVPSVLASVIQFEITESGCVHQCLIQELAFKSLVNSVQRPQTHTKFTILSGPVKSGKTTLLNHVLPALIAENHSTNPLSTKYPVILKHLFVHNNPGFAAEQLLYHLYSFANMLGLTDVIQPLQSNALAVFGEALNSLAFAINARGGCLWLLLDEFQVFSGCVCGVFVLSLTDFHFRCH
jgi:hypothetical protein